MARRRRWFYQGITVHTHHRGNNRMEIFKDDHDRIVYLRALRDASRRFGVAIHAWTLMKTHAHLMGTPDNRESFPRMMQLLGGAYARYFNRRYERTGTLWEGRYKAHPIDTELYWFRCARYIELNPVRASVASVPSEHRWCSYHALGCGAPDVLITPHPLYMALGASTAERQAAYRTLCGNPLTSADLESVRNALRAGAAIAELSEGSADTSGAALGSTAGALNPITGISNRI